MGPRLVLASLMALAFAGCTSFGESGHCGAIERIDHRPSRPFTEEAAVVPDGFEWTIESGSACSQQHVGATDTAVVGPPGPGCSEVTGITGKIFPSRSFPYSFAAATSSTGADGTVTWTAHASDAGLAQGADEATRVDYSVTLRVLYPMSPDPAVDAACIDAMLRDVRIQSTYKSYT